MILADLPIKYALFDMDGTLTDTMPFWIGLPRRLFEKEGLTLSPEEEATLEPLGLHKGIEYLNSLHRTEKIFGREDVISALKASYSGDPTVKPCVRTLLEEFKARGVRMAVATLTPVPLARICFERTGLAPYFEFVIGGEDYPEGKNAPRIFLDAAKNFGCAPEEMVLFEDSYYSVKTARALGISVVGVADASKAEDREDLLAASVAFFDDGFSRRVK